MLLQSVVKFQTHENKEFKELDNSTICSLDFATQRIRELEMDLAQAKVAQVESECHSQNLQHQLSSLAAKAAAATQPSNTTATTHPWKLKWDTVVNNIPSVAQTIPTFQSHISDIAQQLNSFDETK